MRNPESVLATAHAYGDFVSTDEIMPLGGVPKKAEELAQYVMTGIDAEFPGRVCPGDVVVAGEGFGSGSSRESAPMGLKAAGISAVIAASFGRIFYRNCVNIGLMPLICLGLARHVNTGSLLAIDWELHTITTTGGTVHSFLSPKGVANSIVEIGGLMSYLKGRQWQW